MTTIAPTPVEIATPDLRIFLKKGVEALRSGNYQEEYGLFFWKHGTTDDTRPAGCALGVMFDANALLASLATSSEVWNFRYLKFETRDIETYYEGWQPHEGQRTFVETADYIEQKYLSSESI